jgi:hypothetical protein
MNKKKLYKKVQELGCTVEVDLDDGRYKTVHITAPKGKNFGGNHELVTAWQSGSAADLYDEAFEDLEAAIIGLSDCDADTCGAWQENCEYWNE